MKIINPFKNLPEINRTEYNDDFTPYVVFENLFSDTEVERIRNLWEEKKSYQAKVGPGDNAITNLNHRKSHVMPIANGENDWIYTRLGMTCIMVNLQKYKYDILGFQNHLQLAEYGIGNFFGWHMDAGNKNNSNRKLSITVQLSDINEYEGGDLQFYRGNEIVNAPKNKGTAIIFPSFVLHRVQPVTSGSRMSVVGWIAGPCFR